MTNKILVVDKVIGILRLYPTIEQQIKDRTLEVLNPYQISDENIGGGSAGFISNPTEQTAVALCEDELLNSLYYVDRAVDNACRYFRTHEFSFDKFVEIIEDQMFV